MTAGSLAYWCTLGDGNSSGANHRRRLWHNMTVLMKVGACHSLSGVVLSAQQTHSMCPDLAQEYADWWKRVAARGDARGFDPGSVDFLFERFERETLIQVFQAARGVVENLVSASYNIIQLS